MLSTLLYALQLLAPIRFWCKNVPASRVFLNEILCILLSFFVEQDGVMHSPMLLHVQVEMSAEAEELERVQAEYNAVQKMIPASQAADELIAFTKSAQEPFSPDYTGENPWVGGKSGGSSFSFCCVL